MNANRKVSEVIAETAKTVARIRAGVGPQAEAWGE